MKPRKMELSTPPRSLTACPAPPKMVAKEDDPFLLLMAEILHQLRLVVYPIIYRVSYIPGGARFQPSTVLGPGSFSGAMFWGGGRKRAKGNEDFW